MSCTKKHCLKVESRDDKQRKNQEILKQVKIGWRQGPDKDQSLSRSETLAKAVKTYSKQISEFPLTFPDLLNLFTLFHIFCQRLYLSIKKIDWFAVLQIFQVHPKFWGNNFRQEMHLYFFYLATVQDFLHPNIAIAWTRSFISFFKSTFFEQVVL